jgi:hypothetical protein
MATLLVDPDSFDLHPTAPTLLHRPGKVPIFDVPGDPRRTPDVDAAMIAERGRDQMETILVPLDRSELSLRALP